MLRKCTASSNLVIQFNDVESSDMTNEEQPVKVIDFKEQVLKRCIIPYVKVQRSNHFEHKATWEPKSEMRERYCDLFD